MGKPARFVVVFATVVAAVLAVAQPGSADRTCGFRDPEGDAALPYSEGPSYLDMRRSEVTELGQTFVFRMGLAGPVPEHPGLSGVHVIVWAWRLDTDPATFPAGYPLSPGTSVPPEFIVQVRWDGTAFEGILIDRRPLLAGEDALIVPVSFRIEGAEIQASVDSALMEKPSGFLWGSTPTVFFSKMQGTGSAWAVDLPPPGFGAIPWPC